MAGWRTHLDGDQPVHVWPEDDLVQHDTDDHDDGCVCGPTIKPIPRDDGTYGWVIAHHALDGRD